MFYVGRRIRYWVPSVQILVTVLVRAEHSNSRLGELPRPCLVVDLPQQPDGNRNTCGDNERANQPYNHGNPPRSFGIVRAGLHLHVSALATSDHRHPTNRVSVSGVKSALPHMSHLPLCFTGAHAWVDWSVRGNHGGDRTHRET